MTSEIPARVLSQHVRELLTGRRVRAGVFMTYNLEPEFFEQEIVSLLAEDMLIQHPKMRLVQLGEALRGQIGPITVYYDPRGLKPDGARHLDIRYVPIHLRTGFFHPKVVLLLTEPSDASDYGPDSLICGVLSANLTKSGWWSNLECARFEIASEGDRCSYRADLIQLLSDVRKIGGREQDHEALDTIRKWLTRESEPTAQATSAGRLKTRLIAGTKSFLGALDEIRGAQLMGTSLEVVSPFIDATEPKALAAMIERFGIRETRVFLPSANDGTALVSNHLYEAVRSLPGTEWARLPQPVSKLGKKKNAELRGVHAKVYRFHSRSVRYEAMVVGSHNLTSAAHNRGGNFEASFVFERDLKGAIEWWLEADSKKPREFSSEIIEDSEFKDFYIPLEISYDWENKRAEVRWAGTVKSTALQVESAGSLLFGVDSLRSGQWEQIPSDEALKLEGALCSSSIVQVFDNSSRASVLVQEQGMSHKPSLLLTLSITEVLEYWSRLSPELRAAFLSEIAGNIPDGFIGEFEERARLESLDNFFDSYAGIFHGFEMLRTQIVESIERQHYRQTENLLLGKRYDSLPTLIDRVAEAKDERDVLKRYLILLSARQLLQGFRIADADFFKQHRSELSKLIERTNVADSLINGMDLGAEGSQFIAWFEKHFLKSLRVAAVKSDE